MHGPDDSASYPGSGVTRSLAVFETSSTQVVRIGVDYERFAGDIVLASVQFDDVIDDVDPGDAVVAGVNIAQITGVPVLVDRRAVVFLKHNT